jgi:hypothetical protein
MIGQLGTVMRSFRDAFPRGATFHRFVVAVFGFIVRLDHRGVSSSMRWLGVRDDLYETFLAFFRSHAVKPSTVNGVEKTTVVTLMGELLATVTRTLAGPCVAVLDAFFAVAPMFAIAKALIRGRDRKTGIEIPTQLPSIRVIFVGLSPPVPQV